MKSLKFLAAAAVLAGALIQQAAAATPHVYITGSTAFRTAAIASVTTAVHLTGSATLVAGGGTGNDTTYSNANPPVGQSATGTENTSFIWEGGWIGTVGNSTFVTVCATFTGSQTGVCTCMGKLAIPFLPDNTSGTTANASCYLDAQGAFPNITTNTYVVNGTVFSGHYATTIQFTPDMTFTDVFQTTTPFNGTLPIGKPFHTTPTATTFVAGNDNQIGFCTFKWMASKNFPLGTGSTNVNEGPIYGSGYTVSSISIEPNQISQLFSAGFIPLSQLTGSVNSTGGTNNDQTTIVFATGRNPDSGTRGTALADSGYGVLNNVVQYQPTFINGSGVVTTHQKYPIETIAGLSTGSAGNSGEATGGTLRAYLTDTLATGNALTPAAANTTAAYYITYLGTSDAANAAVIGKAVELSWKGVPFSLNAIYQGAYTFWSIEHLYDRGDLVSPQSDTETAIINALNTTTTANFSKAGISNLDVTNNVFQASRQGDGQAVSVSFTP